MATGFAMPVQQFNTSPSQYPYTLYNSQSQQPSPLSSAEATPHNASPSSLSTGAAATAAAAHLPHHPHHQSRQLRPLKTPLYIPAVLRPNEFPKRVPGASPLTPPQSVHDSVEELDGRPLTRDSGKGGLELITNLDNCAGWSEVTASPTRQHWKPDAASEICDSPTCHRYFSYFTRRHHCRRCGNIFCDTHSQHTILLDQDANYHPRGNASRACEHCYREFAGWQLVRSRGSRSSSTSGASSILSLVGHQQQQNGVPRTPVVNCGPRSSLAGVFGKGANGMSESLGASVPRDWNWSTF